MFDGSQINSWIETVAAPPCHRLRVRQECSRIIIIIFIIIRLNTFQWIFVWCMKRCSGAAQWGDNVTCDSKWVFYHLATSVDFSFLVKWFMYYRNKLLPLEALGVWIQPVTTFNTFPQKMTLSHFHWRFRFSGDPKLMKPYKTEHMCYFLLYRRWSKHIILYAVKKLNLNQIHV